jgi:acyl transferase domain-containing protein/aryl carrier-like protein
MKMKDKWVERKRAKTASRHALNPCGLKGFFTGKNKKSFMGDQANFNIAVVGMSGRFPKARHLGQFWENLRAGVEAISRFTGKELLLAGINPALLKDPNYVKAGTILEEAEYFDASFFGFNPREAEIMDPQHRLFLECAYEALENAGYDSQRYTGLIGVFAGAGKNTYFENVLANPEIAESVGGMQTAIANTNDFITTRVSHRLDLRGPSFAVQTACSTSLVAVHLACQSLLSGDCDIALAGGVAVVFPQEKGYLYQPGGIASPDGHCRAFDSKAKGTVGGKGVGVVVLKRLDEAIADADCIHAVIKGSAINNDGAIKIGYTAPDIRGQSLVIRSAQIAAGIDADTITYVETHGTGTELGDPIEFAALTDAFRASTQKVRFCAIGSLKTNIGHADAAAGVAGLIKTVLALQHKQLPPSLHFQLPNPKIDLVNSPFYVNNQLTEWKTGETPRRAGVSSFGIGGTNAHVILEEAPEVKAGSDSRPWQLILLSAKTPTALDAATRKLAEHVEKHPDLNLADMAYTLQVGRRVIECRRMFLCQNREDLLTCQEPSGQQRMQSSRVELHFRPVVFMFPGQGSQYVGMARELYEHEVVFREEVDHCCELLLPHLAFDLRKVLYPEKGREDEAERHLQQTSVTQPALFVIEWAMARLWMIWGIKPQALVGHSIGEYVAACLAGVFTLEDALILVAQRGKLMQSVASGSMLVVPMAEEKLLKILPQTLSLAAVNSPSLCVVSGPASDVEAFKLVLPKLGASITALRTSHAFHSAMMDPILQSFAGCISKVKRNPPAIPFISNITGTWISPADAVDPQYWAKHLRSTVRFADGIKELLTGDKRILLEVGPGTTLCSLTRQQIKPSVPRTLLPSIRHPQERQSDVAFLLKTLGQLWLHGVTVDWSGFYAREQRRRVPLPTYPFERQRYWLEGKRAGLVETKVQPTLHRNPDLADWFYVPSWKRSELPDGMDIPQDKLCWLIFAEEHGLASKLTQKLELLGHDLIRVTMGSRYEKISDDRYTINPESREDYVALIAGLRKLKKIPQKILHFWGISISSLEKWTLLEKTQNLGLHSLLFLAQALGEENITATIEIEAISNNIQNVTGEELVCPGKATALGACKVIPLEYLNIKCRSIDLLVPETGTAAEQKLVDQLLVEVCARPLDSIVAYRGNYRWIETFEPVHLEKSGDVARRLKQGGVYLVTGGLGGMGLTLAEFLANSVRAKLILIGRSTFPAKDQWEQWLATHDVQDAVSRKIHTLRQMEAVGAGIIVAQADVSDLKRMREIIMEAEGRFGRVNGVIHAAGIVDYAGVIQRRTREITEDSLAAKVRGTLVLDELLGKSGLDFLILCSSAGNVFYKVNFGQVGYAAANEFLDAYANYKKVAGRNYTVTINWNELKEIGMAVAARNHRAARENSVARDAVFVNSLSPSESAEVFNRILSYNFTRIIVSTGDLEIFRRRLASPIGTPDVPQESSRPQVEAYRRPELRTAFVAPRNDPEQMLAKILQELLGIEEVGVYDNFFDLGGHSLLGTQLILRLRKVGLELGLRGLYDNPTIAAMAELFKKPGEAGTGETEKLSQLFEQMGQGTAEKATEIFVEGEI